MRTIVLRALILALSLYLFSACCGDETFEVSITGVESRALVSQGSSFVPYDQQNSIDKEDLVLEAYLLESEVLVSSVFPAKKETNDKVLQAAVVPCGDPIFIYANRIESIQVDLLDLDNGNNRIDITNQLVIYETQQNIADFVAQKNEGIRILLFEFSDTTNLPNRVEYDIQISLDDGTVVSAAGGIINFN